MQGEDQGLGFDGMQGEDQGLGFDGMQGEDQGHRDEQHVV